MTGQPSPSRRRPPRPPAGMAGRITGRDRWIVAMLAEHRVLSGPQICLLCFDGERAARARLTLLTGLSVLERFQPRLRERRHPFHYQLGPAGARLLAAERGVSVREIGYRPDEQAALALSPRLGHLVGGNELFVRLSYASRGRPAGQGLSVWWSERRAASIWGDLTRPDGYAVWASPTRQVAFFAEHDTGSESLPRVLRKLPGYTRLAAATGIPSPVLFWLPTLRREAALRAQLPTAGAGFPILTASREHGDPAGPVWLPTHPPASLRLTPDQLADRYGLPPSPPADDPDDPATSAPPPRAPGR